MKHLAVVILLLSGYGVAVAQDFSAYQYHSFISDGYRLNYRILYPEHADSNRRYPLLVMLHGAFGRGNDNNRQLTDGGAWLLQPGNRKQFPAVVVFPQCPENEVWAWFDTDIDSSTGLARRWYFPFRKEPTRVTTTLKALLDSMVTTPLVDSNRVYLGGLSQGGMGVYDMVARYPDFFAAAFPICGAGKTSTAKLFAGHLPLWIFHGAQDRIVPVRFSRDYFRRLRKAGADVRYTEFPATGHDCWDKVFAGQELLPWIYAQSRSGTR